MRDLLKISVLLFFLASAILFNFCIKEEFDPKKLDTEFVINPGIAAPLGYIHYELDEILEDSDQSWKIMVDEDSLMSLVYETEVLSQQASEFLQFSEINHTGYIRNNSTKTVDFRIVRFPVYENIQTDTVFLVLTGYEGPVESEIDSIKVKSINIIVEIITQYDELKGRLIITSPNIRNKYQGKWADWSTAVWIQTAYLNTSVNDCVIILSNDSSRRNVIPLIIKMWPDYSPVAVPAGDPILNYSITINNLEYSAIYGHLGNINIRIDPQTLMVDFFNSLEEGTFYFSQPELRFIFKNSFGIPIQVLTTDFQIFSGDGNRRDITGTGVPSLENQRIINYPALAQLGQKVYDSISLNKDNSNLAEAMEISPDGVIFGIETVTNPYGNNTYNFILDKSQLNVNAKLILPIDGYTGLMIIEDSVKFEFDDFFQNPPEEIKRLALRLNFINGFPVDISTQIYFLDENHAIVDSVFNERYLIQAGTDTDGDGKVDPFKNEPVEVEFICTVGEDIMDSCNKIDNITKSRYIFINGRLNTANYPQSFKFYSYYFLDAFIGVVGDLELNSTGN